MGPDVAVPLGAFITAIILAIGVPLVRAYSRRMDADAKSPRFPSEIAARLERMEQAIDSVALEVERISEGQRFTTKLLSEGKVAADPRQSAPTGTPVRDRAT